MTKRAYLSRDYQRMWDLVRYFRGGLMDAGLITQEEYAQLLGEESSKPGTGSPSAQRLASYDGLRKQLDEARAELASIDSLLARRPALSDLRTRYEKIARTLAVAAHVDELERERARLAGAMLPTPVERLREGA